VALLMRVAAAFRGVTVAPMPAGHRLLALSDVPDRQRRDGPAEPGSAAMGTLGVPIGCLAGRGHRWPALPIASQKRRGVCPSCNGRHMAQTAAHLFDHILPPVPVRQWVISPPRRPWGGPRETPATASALRCYFEYGSRKVPSIGKCF